MQQNGTSYLGNFNFLNEYMSNPSHIHCETFWDRFGITAQQCMADISWLNGVLTMTIDDPDNIPELNSASGDGVIALANLAAVYSNNGKTEQDTRWNIRDQIKKEYDPSTMSLPEYMHNFQTFVLKHQHFNANYGREEVLDQLKKNIISVIPNMDNHFDRVSQQLDPWVTEIQYLVRKAPKNISKRNMTRPGMKQNVIFLTHLNAVSTDSPHLHQVTSLDELKELVIRSKYIDNFILLVSVYRLFI
jgi:hypothetical protein